MDKKMRIKLFYPVFIFLLYFALDKTCLHPEVKKHTQNDAVFLYFDYKEELLDELAAIDERIKNESSALSRNKVFLVLGSSRLMFFDYRQFSRNFPEWEIFNFSAPVTGPAYYLYILEETLKRGGVPDYILVETDPYQFNENSSVFEKSNLAYSFNLPFIMRHSDLLTNSEISGFLARTLFAGFKYPPDPEVLLERLKDPEEKRLLWLNKLDEHQRANRGAGRSLLPRPDWYERNFPNMEVIAHRDLRRLYGNYRFSDRQFQFLRRILELARKHQIKTALVRPQVSRPMEKLIAENEKLVAATSDWYGRIGELQKDYSFPLIDLPERDDYYCNTFFDPSHMSLDCYHPMLIIAMREYNRMVGRGY